MSVCRRCLFDDTVKNITFDQRGVCTFCRLQEAMREERRNADVGALFSVIRRRGRSREYDCIVPVSGGVDSRYVFYYVIRSGLRPIAVHTDNGWVTEVAARNMTAVTAALDVPLVRITQDWDVLRSGYRAFLEASVPEICSACEVTSLSELLAWQGGSLVLILMLGLLDKATVSLWYVGMAACFIIGIFGIYFIKSLRKPFRDSFTR